MMTPMTTTMDKSWLHRLNDMYAKWAKNKWLMINACRHVAIWGQPSVLLASIRELKYAWPFVFGTIELNTQLIMNQQINISIVVYTTI